MKNNRTQLAMIILMFNTFITMAGIGLIIPIMPSFLKGFGAAGQALGFIIAMFSLGQFLFSPFAGRLSDRKGRKRVILIGLLIYASSQLAFSLSTELWMLYVARFFSGFGSAFLIPPMMAFVADITPHEKRGKGMGMLAAAMSLGFMIGPALGGFLAQISLLFPLYFATGATLFAFVLSFFFLPSIEPTPEQIQQASQKTSLLKQMVESTKENYFVLLIVMFVFSFGLANFQSTLSLFADQKFNYGATEIAIIITVGGFVGVIIQSLFIQPLFNKFGEIRIIHLNLLIAAVAMFSLIFTSTFWSILLVATIFSTATSLLRPAINTLVSKLASKNRQGFASGMMNAYMSLGNMVGPALAGTLFDWKMYAPYLVGTLILLISFSISMVWTSKNPKVLHAVASNTQSKAIKMGK